MTMKEFLTRLARTQRKWILRHGQIRAFAYDAYICPIQAVASMSRNFITGWVEASAELGLTKKQRRDILAAADNRPIIWIDIRGFEKLRAALLKACKLKEPQ